MVEKCDVNIITDRIKKFELVPLQEKVQLESWLLREHRQQASEVGNTATALCMRAVDYDAQ